MSEIVGNRPGRASGGRDWLMLPVLAGGCLLLGTLSGVISSSGAGNPWYDSLGKPALTPPGWVFGVVWTLLYLMMGTAAWLVWRHRDRPGARTALALFALQFVLNLAWSPAFFGLQNVVFGFAAIVPLLLAVAAATVAFWRVARVAGLLLTPYLAWVGFASVLSYQIWQLNAQG